VGKLWVDTFESAAALSLNYTNIVDAETNLGSGVGSGWGARTTGSASAKYYGAFTKGGLGNIGRSGYCSGDFDQAFDDDNGSGFSAFEVRYGFTWGLSLYHGLGVSRDNLEIHSVWETNQTVGTALGVITPNTFQNLRLTWRTSTWTNSTLNADGEAIAYVNGIAVITATNIKVGFANIADPDPANTIFFGPMGHLDNIEYGYFNDTPLRLSAPGTSGAGTSDSGSGGGRWGLLRFDIETREEEQG